MPFDCNGICVRVSISVQKAKKQYGKFYDHFRRCSICEEWFDKLIYPFYCPCCGTKLRWKKRDR